MDYTVEPTGAQRQVRDFATSALLTGRPFHATPAHHDFSQVV